MEAVRLFFCFAFLEAFTSGVEVQCKYEIVDWIHVGDVYICRATIRSVENPTIVTEISGTHKARKSSVDVEGFAIRGHAVLTAIPNGIEKFFPSLKAFYWGDGNISTIDSSTFEPFPNLLRIDLGNNKLVSLNGDLLQHTRKLRSITFIENKLEHVGHDLLTGLTHLKSANFAFNPCINEWPNTPEGIQDLNRRLPITCPPLAATTISTTNE